ncbi:MAG: hypothetical protein HPY50_05965 [Firmicutes bacterium]|nr:hypothetical protein [Bacillota bacterium]
MSFFVLGIALMAAVYTGSYGWWAWQKKYYLGAIGTWVVALAGLGLPLYAILRGGGF